jgi:hypothetical protein
MMSGRKKKEADKNDLTTRSLIEIEPNFGFISSQRLEVGDLE